MHVWFVEILLPDLFMDDFIGGLFLEVMHIYICSSKIGAQICDGRHIWVGEGGQGFVHDGWLLDVTLCCSEVLLQFLHFSGEFFGRSLPIPLWYGLKSCNIYDNKHVVTIVESVKNT